MNRQFGTKVFWVTTGGFDAHSRHHDRHGRPGAQRPLGTAAKLRQDPANPALENAAGDVRYETDFRSVYARVLDDWLGANSVNILGADFRGNGPGIL